MARGKRVAYKVAGVAMRDALSRAVVMAGYLKPRDWRVLVACAAVTTSYSRVEDETTVGQLVDLSGLSRQSVSGSLARLSAAGVIRWQPTETRGKAGASRVSIAGGAPDWLRLRGEPPIDVDSGAW